MGPLGAPWGPMVAPWAPSGPHGGPLGPQGAPRGPKSCFGLAGLPVVPSLGLVWPGPVLPALPATTTAAAKPPPAAEGGRLLLLDQAKARRARQARQARARPSQGWAQQASQPSQSRRFKGPRVPVSHSHMATVSCSHTRTPCCRPENIEIGSNRVPVGPFWLSRPRIGTESHQESIGMPPVP